MEISKKEQKLITDFYMWMVENEYDHNIRLRVRNKAEMFLREQQQVKKLNIDDVSKRYSEQDMLNAAKYGYEYRDTTSFPEMDFDSNCKNNTRQWLTTVK